jgi:hypothetical protein
MDYSTREGSQAYKLAIAPLFTEAELFNCEASDLFTFIGTIDDRADQNGWHSSILSIPADITQPMGGTINMITSYGMVTLEHLQEHARTYVATQTRAAQDSVQLYLCIMNSLTKAGKSKVKIWKNQYTVGGFKSGACLLKVIIRESHIDTNATTGHIRTRLTMLDTYLPTIGNDIVKFNQHVNTLLEGLTSRDETTNDLLTNLFKGYKAASDKTFVAYIKKKEEDYDEGQNIPPENLMILAANKYKILKEKNEWEAPSADKEKIMALEARITKMAK